MAHASTIIAPSEQVSSQRATSAQSELAAPESAMSTPAATDIVDIEVGGDDSPLSSASPEVVRLPRWDDLGRSHALNSNLVHKFIPSFSFKGTVTRPRSSSSLQQQLDSSRANDERIGQSLRQRQWTEAQIATLLFPSSPSSSSAVDGHGHGQYQPHVSR